MGLDAMWHNSVNVCYQVWVWVRQEVSQHPFLFLGTVIVIVAAWILYKTEVRGE
jgi:drug/metabolite transporter superfamily protein YnfA